nr:co-chaperone protein p23-1-like [Lolium perenne]
MEARRAALEERLAANEERKLALEEKKQANEEHLRLVEEERKLFLMDTSNLDERKNEYINLARDEVLAKKRLLVANMNTPTIGMLGGGISMFGGGVGGMPGVGDMPGIGGFGGMAGMGGPRNGGVFAGTKGASVNDVYGAMGAPAGGFVAYMDPTIPHSSQGVDKEEAKDGDDLKNVEV